VPTPPIEIKKQWRVQKLPGMKRGRTKLGPDAEKDGIDTYVIFKYGKTGYKYHHFKRIRNDCAYAYSEISVCDRALSMKTISNKGLLVRKGKLHEALSAYRAGKKKLKQKDEAVLVSFCMV